MRHDFKWLYKENVRNHEKRKHFKGHLISNVKFGGMKYSKEEVYAFNTEQKICMTLIQNKVPERVFSLMGS